MGGVDLARPRPRQRRRDDRGLFRADQRGAEADRARRRPRGRARVITAAKSDNTATIAAARFTYNRLLKRGVEMFEYQPTKLHSKLLVMDDVVQIGSSNFDIRSLYLNLELMLRVDDRRIRRTDAATISKARSADSLPITAELHAKRATLANRIKWALSFFLVTSADYTVTRRAQFRRRMNLSWPARDTPRTGSRAGR